MKKLIVNYLKIVNIFLVVLVLMTQDYFKESLMTSGYLSFTYQSNIFAMFTTFISVIVKNFVNPYKNKRLIRFTEVLQIISSVAITLTFVVFNFLLMPGLIARGDIYYVFTFTSVIFHFVSPLIHVITFLFLDSHFYKATDGYYGVIFPFYYLFFVFFCNFNKVEFTKDTGNAKYFPYFFMNYYDNGFFKTGDSILNLGFGYWLIILTILTIIITFTFFKIIKKISNPTKTNC